MNLDITPAYEKAIRKILKKHIPDQEVWAFGSRVRWTAKDTSDLDLVIRSKEKISFKILTKLKLDFEMLEIPFTVDILDWQRLSKGFQKIIKEEYIIFQRGKSQDNKFPSHWKRSNLYDLAEWINGLAYKNINFSSKGLPIIKISELKNGLTDQTKYTRQTFKESVRVENGNILFAWSGQPETSIDVFKWEGEEGWLNQHIFKIFPKSFIDSDFIFYLLRYMKPIFISIARNKQTTGLGHVTINDMKKIFISYPEAKIQEKISSMLVRIDNKIQLNLKINEKLESMAQVIFKSWFVDFDPVHAKKLAIDAGLSKKQAEKSAMAIISGICSPEEYVKNYKQMDKKLSNKLSSMSSKEQKELANIASLFPSDFEDSELGKISKGYSVDAIKNIAFVKSGFAFSGDNFKKEGFPVIKIKNINDSGRVHLDDIQFISKIVANKASDFILKTGDFLIAMTGAKVGKCGFLILNDKPAYLNQRVGKIEPITQLHFPYIYTLFTRTETRMAVINKAHGSAQPNISTKEIENIRIVMPTSNLIDTFSMLFESVIKKITASEREILKLKELRDILLPKLLSGEIDLSKIKLENEKLI